MNPEWRKIRKKVIGIHGGKCDVCGMTEMRMKSLCRGGLHCHHKYYDKGKLPWEYPLTAFSVLCDNCHTVEHINQTRQQLTLVTK